MISQDMEKITKQEVEDFKRLYNRFDDLTDEIIRYITEKKYGKYLIGNIDIESYGYPCSSNLTFDVMILKYNEEDHYFIQIPWEDIYNDTWKEYLDDQVKEDIEKEKARQEKERKMLEERERQQLKRLLEKYSNNI